jgi:predicted acylesterase/phospholipase RssA
MSEQPQAEARTEECDLVMKGGITSGVVYPSAVLRLAQRYRFRNVGGASVGAIAAAVTAAAEYGWATGKGTGFAQLDEINKEVVEEGLLLSLFKPRQTARGLYAIYLAAIGRRNPVRMAGAVTGQAVWVILLLLAWLGTLAVTASWLGDRWWLVPALLGAWGLIAWIVAWGLSRRLSLAGVLGGLLLPILWPLLLAVPAVGIRAWRDLSAHGFGLVPGASAGGGAVCDWVHHHVQAAAGLGDDQPLTFGMLRDTVGQDGKPVELILQMMTTNLSIARPMRVPRDLTGYAFDPEDLRDVLPAPVVTWLVEHGTPERGVVRLPPEDELPVLLGFRLSLSFPLLFTALRLYAPLMEKQTSRLVPHWFSDGGIGSNFPVHFFDTWLPGRPTFALSFAPFPRDHAGLLQQDESDIGLPLGPNDQRFPRWVHIDGMSGFIGQMLETMQNWRDTVQSELPGFRDRVYEARLDKEAGEGGLNLGMDRATIERLQDRGSRVGEAILETFDRDQHVFTRYLMTMQQLEMGLLGSDDPGSGRRRPGLRTTFAQLKERFAAGNIGASELFGRDSAWLPPAGAATSALLDLADTWRKFGSFASDEPRPQPAIRIVPDV